MVEQKLYRVQVRFERVYPDGPNPHAWAVISAAGSIELPFDRDELPPELWKRLQNPENLPYRCHAQSNVLSRDNYRDTWYANIWVDWELE